MRISLAVFLVTVNQYLLDDVQSDIRAERDSVPSVQRGLYQMNRQMACTNKSVAEPTLPAIRVDDKEVDLQTSTVSLSMVPHQEQ